MKYTFKSARDNLTITLRGRSPTFMTMMRIFSGGIIGLLLCISVLGQSTTDLEAKADHIRNLVERIKRDNQEYEDAKKRAPELDTSSGHFEPAEIGQVIARYKRDLQVTEAHRLVLSNYFEDCFSRLSMLSELEPYFVRLRSANQAVETHGSDASVGTRELLSVLEKMQQAYARNDPRSWNALAEQLPSLFARMTEAAKRTRAAAATGESIMEEVQIFLAQKLQVLDKEIDRIRREEAISKITPTSTVQPKAVVGLSFLDLVNIFNEAADKAWKPDPNAPGRPFPKGGQHAQMDKNCSQHFREIMRAVKRRGFEVAPQWMDDRQCDANCLIELIRKSKEWEPVAESKVQERANAGNVVVGVAPGREVTTGGRKLVRHGHIAVAFPISPDFNDSGFGSGPFIRDGNERYLKNRLFASSWGAVKASNGPPQWFKTPPSWYLYVPTKQ